MSSKSLTPKLPALTLYHLAKSSADAYQDSTAQYARMPDGYTEVSFRDLFEEIEQIGAGLVAAGVKKKENVGFIADVGHMWLRISFAITGCGAVDVPRGTDATREDMEYIFHHAGCKFIIIENENVLKKLKPALKKLTKVKTIVIVNQTSRKQKIAGIKILSLEELKEKATEKSVRDFHKRGESIREDDLATIIYTSGTTGNPKGVMLSHKNLAWESSSASSVMDLGPGDVTMGYLPPWHIAERLIETSAFYVGSAVAFTSVQTLSQDLKEIRPTYLISVPRVWESMYSKIVDGVKKASPVKRGIFNFFSSVAREFSIQYDILIGTKYMLEPENILLTLAKKGLAMILLAALYIPNALGQLLLKKIKEGLGGRVRFAVSGAGALPEHIDRFFYSVGIPIIEVYGMTETAGVSTFRDLKHPAIGTVGKPFEGVSMKLLDEAGNIVSKPGVKGVAWHKGSHIMQGYYKDPKRTKETLVDGWLNSGDLMMWTVQGDLKFAGRAKDTIVLLGGENLEPEPIENMLKSSGFVAQVVVVGQDKKTLGALIVPNTEQVQIWHKTEFGVEAGPVETWNEDENIRKLFREMIRQQISAQNGFKTFERITTFEILPKEFEVGAEMTQTLKIKRNVVFEKYAKTIKKMYRED